MKAFPLTSTSKWFLCAFCCLALSGVAVADPINPGPGSTVPTNGSFFDVFFHLTLDSDLEWLLPDGGTTPEPLEPPQVFPIVVVEMQLRSADPVMIGGSFFEVYVQLDHQSLGEMHIAPNGHFDSFFDVFVDITLDQAGGGTIFLPHMEQRLRMSGDWTLDPQGNLQLDNVTVIGTPEPATLCLVGSSLALWARRRRR